MAPHQFKEVEEHLHRLVDTVFNLATGKLALSITFKSSLKGAAPNLPWLLSEAWLLLSLTVLFYLLFQFTTVIGKMDEAIESADVELKSEGKFSKDFRAGAILGSNLRKTYTHYFSEETLATFPDTYVG